MSSNDDLIHAILDALVNGNIDTNVGVESIASWTGLHVHTRPATAATTTVLTNQSSIQNSTSYDAGYIAYATGVQITSSAALSAGAIQVQNSLDNTSWANAGASIVAATDFPAAATKIYSFGANTNGAARFWRVAITTALVGGTITAKVRSS